MTNQENPSPLQVAQKEAYDLGVRTQKRKLKRIKKCLYKEQQWTEKLENALKRAGLPLPDPYPGKLARILSFFARRWRSMLTVVLITLTLALIAIAFWPHYHNEDLHSHWRNPFEVLANFEQT